jgi:hypothetical protein
LSGNGLLPIAKARSWPPHATPPSFPDDRLEKARVEGKNLQTGHGAEHHDVAQDGIAQAHRLVGLR